MRLSCSPRTYRLPPRVTYNDIKRLAYIADLANPTVPLYKLARQSVPHGYKGIDLLETMWSPAPPVANNQPQAASSATAAAATPPGPVPVDRAAWFVRVLGANEVVVLRNRPANANALAASWTGKPLTPSQLYTVEFTGVYTAFLRKQLMDLVLPQSSLSAKAVAGSQGASGAALGKQSTGGGRNAGVLGDTAARARWVAKWDYR
jgi:mediator of RNA polymerase II transcription subunit 12